MADTKRAIQLEEGTYEIIRGRLNTQVEELRSRLGQLNGARKEVFGAIETKLIATDRIHTDNYCIARDIAAVGQRCLFGYNVHVGLRSGIQLSDVFSTYSFEGNSFKLSEQSLIQDPKFEQDFQNLYRYYKEAYFAKFLRLGSYLYMVFRLGKTGLDFKSFKWLVKENDLVYVDNRSDHEVRDPEQYEFRWERATRDVFRFGKHPHVSILDRVFVETVGGDLTIKVEDNTDDGLGIYREPVESADQSLDDAEYFYADLGNLIVLKIRPYQEDFRYFVYNEKMQEVQRVDTLERSGILLPDNQGLIFANGYYLQTGEFKLFEQDLSDVHFERRIVSPNGEDFLYVFYNREHGVYVLMPYNLIEQKVAVPILCNGFTLFPNGELCYFRAEDEPTKHHVIQIWQTPLIAGDTVPSQHADSFLYKVGNKDIVKAMAECQSILTLASKEDTYSDLYADIVKKATDMLDSYYWIGNPEAFELDNPIRGIRQTAETAIDEYEKKVRVSRETRQATEAVQQQAVQLIQAVNRQSFDQIDQYVQNLAEIRQVRGEVIGLKELRYANIDLIESLENQLTESNGKLSEACVQFLLQENSLQPYQRKVDELEGQLGDLQTAIEAKELDAEMQAVGKELELLIDIVSNLKIEDATQTTRIINHISGMYAHLNQVRAKLKNIQKSLQSTEAEAEFAAQLNLVDQGIINYLDLADTPEECDSYLSKLIVQLEELEGKFVEFDEFIERLAEKREAIFNTFEGRKKQLVEALNNRTSALMRAGERLLNGIQNRAQGFKEAADINAFFAGDLLIDKVRDIVTQLGELGDSNKAGDIQTRLKILKEDALRQLRDRKDLFVDGAAIIKFGTHRFSVNTQPLDLTVVRRGPEMNYHLTGTDFYQTIQEPTFLATRSVWDQLLPSENKQVYRAEFLAYQIFNQLEERPEDLAAYVREFAATRFDEGYMKGVHDADATLLLEALLELADHIDLLRYRPRARACAWLFWEYFAEAKEKQLLEKQLKSAGAILKVFPKTHEFDYLRDQLRQKLTAFLEETRLFEVPLAVEAADYLFQELNRSEAFVCSRDAFLHYEDFLALMKKQKSIQAFEQSQKDLEDSPVPRFQLIRKWVHAYLESLGEATTFAVQDEIAVLLLRGGVPKQQVIQAGTTQVLEGLHGQHPVLQDGKYRLDYHAFLEKLIRFTNETVPEYQEY
ncbi:MAG: DNA repair ATPase, partial [Phaeodactylibacter sp.]|nr:DNA repair ATPase [Phaeodactylibacter sp.]